jgi:DNA-directed RNA polymerase specialized sigma24 family protein
VTTISLADLPADAETTADWTVLQDPHVENVAQAVARGIARDYGLTLEYEDAYQEALLILALRAPQVRQLVAAGPGLLHRWLRQRLRDHWLTEAKHRARHVPYTPDDEPVREGSRP